MANGFVGINEAGEGLERSRAVVIENDKIVYPDSSTEGVVGFTMRSGTTGDLISVDNGNQVWATASGSISAGDFLYVVGSEGKVSDASGQGNIFVVGNAQEDASDGQEFKIRFSPSFSSGSIA